MFSDILQLAETLTRPEGGLSAYQRTLLKAYAGMPLDRAETAIWRKATGRTGMSAWLRGYKARPASELWLYCGRRAGKTTLGSIAIIWEGLRRPVPASQSWTIPIITPGLRQSQRISLDYIRRKMQSVPELAELLTAETQDSLTFSTGVVVRTLPPDPRVVQGFTAPLVWLDEASGFRDESAFSNLQDVLDAVRPSIATIPDAKVLLTSLPGPKIGPLYDAWQDRFNRDGALIFKASSVEMNPGLAKSPELEKARKRPEHYALYYSGEFVDSRQTLIPAELIDAAIIKGRAELAPKEFAGMAAAGGCDFAASSDDCAAAICIRTKEDRLVVPWVRNWTVKSGSLHPVYSYLEEIAAAFSSYGVHKAVGDQQSLAAASQYLGEKGVEYVRLVTNGQASEPVFDFLREQLRAGRLSLPDNEILRSQLKRLEERRDGASYEVAATKGRDDLAVAVAACVFRAGQLPFGAAPSLVAIFTNQSDEDRGWQRQNEDGSFGGPQPRVPSFGRQRVL